MRLIVLNCLLLASVAVSLPNGRDKRHLIYLKNLINSAISGVSQVTVKPPPILQEENGYKLFKLPGFDDVMVKVAPKNQALEEFVYPVAQPVNLNAFGKVVGTKSKDDTLTAMKGVESLLSSGILYGDQNNFMKKNIAPMFPSLNNYVVKEKIKTAPVIEPRWAFAEVRESRPIFREAEVKETRPVLTEVIKPRSILTDVRETRPVFTEIIENRPAFTEFIGQRPAFTEIIEPRPVFTNLVEPRTASTEIFVPRPALTEVIEPGPAFTEIIEPRPLLTEVIEPRPFFTEVIEPRPVFTDIIEPSSVFTDIIEPGLAFTEVIEPRPVFTEIIEPRPYFTEAIESRPLFTDVFEPRPACTEVIEPRPVISEVIEPKPVFTEIIEPKPVVSEVIEPRPSFTEIIEPRPVFTEVIEAKPAFTEVIEPRPTFTEIIEPRPSFTEIIEPRPSFTEIIEPRPVFTEVIEPKPAFTEVIEPRPTFTKIIENRPVFTEIIEPRPAFTEIIEPRPVFTEVIEPRPTFTEIIEPRPIFSEIIKPRPVFKEIIEPKPAFTEVIEPRPSLTEIIQPRPVFTEVIEPKPAFTEVIEPRPTFTEIIERRPVSEVIEPRPAFTEVIEPRPVLTKVIENSPVLSEVVRPIEEKVELKVPFEPTYFYQQIQNNEPVMTFTGHTIPGVELMETIKTKTELPMYVKNRVDEALVLSADPKRFSPVQEDLQYKNPPVVDFSYPLVKPYEQKEFPEEVLTEGFGPVADYRLSHNRLRPVKDEPTRYNLRPMKTQAINPHPIPLRLHKPLHSEEYISASKDKANSQTKKVPTFTYLGDKVDISQTLGPIPPQYISHVSDKGEIVAEKNKKTTQQVKEVPLVSSKDAVSNAKIPDNVYKMQSNPNTGKVVTGNNDLRTNVKTSTSHYVPVVNSVNLEKDAVQEKVVYTNKVVIKPQSTGTPAPATGTDAAKLNLLRENVQPSFKNNPIVLEAVKDYSYHQKNADGSSVNVIGNKHGVSVDVKQNNPAPRGDIPG